ncbi:pyruvate phosphate dikinase PEP/pyruvate-binding protein [Desulfovibrio sp. X2]|uniref:PEP/pyruvate-binding domain-containing protein n=1 Tax=Desulfovibrio sp. X2 TaxID=941449 RepID=UPI000358988B|nr:PEP/pyruvate-binding domain-containing protein [Desulfovibrio sp. X2]EPR37376.1 pyruvate phosphate dikinase PEP/pyruvate-binding protein [Desulfovibrio sp. X2]
MKALRRLWKLLFPGDPDEGVSREGAEELRAAFRARYHDFKLLLTAHGQFLENMAAVEEALQSATPFGMELVRGLGVAAATGVFRMIRLLAVLVPGRYGELEQRFSAIREQLAPILSPPLPDDPASGAGAADWVLPLAGLTRRRSGIAGFPAASVGEIAARLPGLVPPGFVITAAGFRAFMAHEGLQAEIDRRIQAAGARRPDELAALSEDLRALIVAAPLPSELASALAEACERIAAEQETAASPLRLSLRGEAVVEAAAGAALVGHERTMLNVHPDQAATAFKELAARKFGPLAMAARLVRGLRNRDVSMVVTVQAMTGARAGGVLLTRVPRNGGAAAAGDAGAGEGTGEEMLLAAALGLPDAVTEGTSDADTYLLARGAAGAEASILSRSVQHKAGKFVCDPERGLCRMLTTDGEADLPALADGEIIELARIGREVEGLLGAAVELEWVLDESGRVSLLHCRHLGLRARHGPPGGKPRVLPSGCETLLQGGATASPGLAGGSVHVVESAEGLVDFPPGGVLVAASADPRLAALLPSCAAVVTQTGAATSRLAGICREWGIPALMGVAGATTQLAQGEEVLVDADEHAVRRARPDACPVEAARPTRSPLLGSPVHEALVWAADLIIPLYLTDAGSADFSPSSCRTLHDIAHFVHETSVEQMFSFCQSHDFAQAKSRRLVCQVPMQFWVVNLDDGYWRDEPGDTVRLSNIASLPMLALWKGMMAVPWGGPPGVNPRGFLSVVFEATTNPELDPVAGSQYSVKNYFMISRNFCSLQSRFGFHFCSVEALVGERAVENYAAFRFEGGAANMERRMRRIHFIAGILKEFGFASEIVEDRLLARAKGLPQPVMEERLAVLGYLITHTRQLDMVMTDMASVKALRARMTADLARLFPPEGA